MWNVVRILALPKPVSNILIAEQNTLQPETHLFPSPLPSDVNLYLPAGQLPAQIGANERSSCEPYQFERRISKEDANYQFRTTRLSLWLEPFNIYHSQLCGLKAVLQ